MRRVRYASTNDIRYTGMDVALPVHPVAVYPPCV